MRLGFRRRYLTYIITFTRLWSFQLMGRVCAGSIPVLRREKLVESYLADLVISEVRVCNDSCISRALA